MQSRSFKLSNLKTSPFSVAEKGLKQESMLQEGINCSQGTDVATHDHEVEDTKPGSHCAMRATQVKGNLLH